MGYRQRRANISTGEMSPTSALRNVVHTTYHNDTIIFADSQPNRPYLPVKLISKPATKDRKSEKAYLEPTDTVP